MDLISQIPLTPEWMLFLMAMVFLAGLVDSAAGGGGLISLPAYLACGLPTYVAYGCNKFSSAVGTTFSALRYFRHGAMDLPVAATSAACALVGGALGSRIALAIDPGVLKTVVICALPVAALIILLRRGDMLAPDRSDEVPLRRRIAIAVGIGLGIGCYDGLVGPGTGTFAIIVFNLLARYDLVTAGGNAKAMNLASNYGSLATLLVAGQVNFAIGGLTAVACIAGHLVGSGLALKRGARFIRPMLVVVLCLLMVSLVRSTFFAG